MRGRSIWGQSATSAIYRFKVPKNKFAENKVVPDFFKNILANLLFKEGGIALHAASIVKDDYCLIFVGPSGSGKTTVANLARGRIVLDDELTFVKFKEGYFKAFDFQNENSYIIKAIFSLYKDNSVYLEPLSSSAAIAEILTIPNPLFDIDVDGGILESYNELIKKVPVYRLHFRKEPSFWRAIEDEL